MRQILRINRRLNAPQELILVRLLVTLGAASIVATSSLYLKSLGMSDAAIGLSTGLIMVINLLFALTLPVFLYRFNLTNILFTTIIGFSVTLAAFGSMNRAIFALLFYVLGRLLLSLFSSAYSILFHDDSASPSSYRKNQALSGSLINFSWMIMPFFATLIIGQFSFTILYVLAAAICLCGAVVLKLQTVPEKIKNAPKHIGIFKNIKFYFTQKKLRDIYLISAGVDIWWVFIFVFVTLFLKENGYSTAAIGAYLTLGQLPLFLFEFKAYTLVEKYRFKAPFINSFSFMAFAMIIAAFFGLTPVTLGIFIFTSLFLVFVEPAREMYLYENTAPKDEERVQPVYATAELVGSIIARLSIGLILVWANETAAYVVMAVIMICIALHNRSIKD
jgi:MFS family permease